MKSILRMINQYFEKLFSRKAIADNDQSLFSIVTRSLSPYQIKAKAQRSKLINAIPDDVMLHMDKERFLKMLGKLLSTVLLYGKETRLAIHANCYKDILIVTITSSNTYNGYAIHAQFDELQSFVNKFGAVIEIESTRNKETTLSLTMLNKSSAQIDELLLTG